jgi:hypothetical protein
MALAADPVGTHCDVAVRMLGLLATTPVPASDR